MGQYLASLGGVRAVDTKHAFGFDRKHLTKTTAIEHEADGRPAGHQREYRDGRVDARVLARPVTVALRDHDPRTNAAFLRRIGLDNPRYAGFVRGLPFSREVIHHLEAITGKRFGGETRKETPCPS